MKQLWHLLVLSNVGFYQLNGETTPKPIICSSGSYYNQSSSRCLLCPSGTYGDRSGLVTTACSGECAPGYFCPQGSTTSMQNVCGSTKYYCPRASGMRRDVDSGYYTVTAPLPTDDTTQRAQRTAVNKAERQIMCEPGYYCVYGVRRACPAGVYGDQSGLTDPACVAMCPKGHYCPIGTSIPLACPPGTYGSDLGLTTALCSGLCPVGHYCLASTITPRPCPPGSFGATKGLTTKMCSSICSTSTCVPAPCPEGYYCPLATVTPIACGSVDVYCPTGSTVPILVSTGYYTVWKTARGVHQNRLDDAYITGGALAVLNMTTRTGQQLCERGSYCIGGVKQLCPPGTYGDSEGLFTAQCAGQCPPGYFCPLGTTDYYLHPCNARDVFCRLGSTTPTAVSMGYYTITAMGGGVRVDQMICPQGSYCVGGVKYLCPAGTYGATTGLSTPQCTGRCQDGYICPTGSVSVNQTPCPAGQYSRNGIACAPCAPGYWCSAASPDPYQNECGSDTVYCPLGSSGPQNVVSGAYAVGQQVTTHTSQAVCAVQTVAHVPQCPTRTIGVNSGL